MSSAQRKEEGLSPRRTTLRGAARILGNQSQSRRMRPRIGLTRGRRPGRIPVGHKGDSGPTTSQPAQSMAVGGKTEIRARRQLGMVRTLGTGQIHGLRDIRAGSGTSAASRTGARPMSTSSGKMATLLVDGRGTGMIGTTIGIPLGSGKAEARSNQLGVRPQMLRCPKQSLPMMTQSLRRQRVSA